MRFINGALASRVFPGRFSRHVTEERGRERERICRNYTRRRCIINMYYKFLNEQHTRVACTQIFDLSYFRNHRPFRLSAISSILPSPSSTPLPPHSSSPATVRLVTVQGFFNFSFVFCSTSHEMNTRSMHGHLVQVAKIKERASINLSSLPVVILSFRLSLVRVHHSATRCSHSLSLSFSLSLSLSFFLSFPLLSLCRSPFVSLSLHTKRRIFFLSFFFFFFVRRYDGCSRSPITGLQFRHPLRRKSSDFRKHRSFSADQSHCSSSSSLSFVFFPSFQRRGVAKRRKFRQTPARNFELFVLGNGKSTLCKKNNAN